MATYPGSLIPGGFVSAKSRGGRIGSVLGTVYVANIVVPTPPVISNVSPGTGVAISATAPLEFDVTDNSGLFRRVVVKLQFVGQEAWEIAYDGDYFDPRYSVGSSRAVITNGWRYTLNRDGGWPGSPTLTVFAIDQQGWENG
jgi:hypothetical protein